MSDELQTLIDQLNDISSQLASAANQISGVPATQASVGNLIDKIIAFQGVLDPFLGEPSSLTDIPDVSFACEGQLRESNTGTWVIRRAPDSTTESRWFSIPDTTSVGIIAATDTHYLVGFTSTPGLAIGWLDRSAFNGNNCGDIPREIPNISIAPPGDSSLQQGEEPVVPRYIYAQYGIQSLLDFAENNAGWWGDAGDLSLWDIFAYVIDQEIYRAVDDDSFREWAVAAHYERLRLAIEQCGETVDWQCDGWYQFFSGLTVTFTTAPIHLPEATTEDQAIQNFANWGNIPQNQATINAINDILQRIESGEISHSALVEQSGLFWWSYNEIACVEQQSEYLQNNRSDLYLQRYQTDFAAGGYLFSGTYCQFQKAFAECIDRAGYNC